MSSATERTGTDGDVTARLCTILSRHLDGQDIGADDDFYAMGGDSLIALQVVADACQAGIAVTLRDLIFNPTARELAAVASAGPAHEPTDAPADEPFALLGAVDRAVLPAGLADALPASALQLGIIYQCEVTGDPRLYHSVIGLRVGGPFDEPLFREALAELFARHPALRTSFDLSSFSAPMHLVWASVAPVVQIESHDHDDDAEADRWVNAWRERELAAAIDWAAPPLVRCHVVAMPGSFRLALSIHHAIVDGWSYARLIVDLLTLYDAKLGGTAARLPEPPVGIAREFVVAERAAEESAAAARPRPTHRAWWATAAASTRPRPRSPTSSSGWTQPRSTGCGLRPGRSERR